MSVGIEAINFYGGSAYVDVIEIFKHRNLDLERYDNLMLDRKAVGAPWEDPVTNAVNAAKPIIDRMSEADKSRIELVVASSESGIDFGKALSTYVHDYLGLSKTCRIFEVKQACYGGTAAFQMANCFVASQVSPGAKALVLSTDIARAAAKGTYVEPSQGVGAIAMVVGENPEIMELDFGAVGYHSYEVMDTCRPAPDIETGDPDLSLLSYLDCLENSYHKYAQKVEGVDLATTFDYFAFHTPFAGMVKGGHRKLMSSVLNMKPALIKEDFEKRVRPSLNFCVQVGNVYSATLYLALCSLVSTAEIDTPKRVGFFSYGSGCSSEFYSGIVTSYSQKKILDLNIQKKLDDRYHLSFEEYDHLLDLDMEWKFGIQDKKADPSSFRALYEHSFEGKGLLVLNQIKGFHREYRWS